MSSIRLLKKTKHLTIPVFNVLLGFMECRNNFFNTQIPLRKIRSGNSNTRDRYIKQFQTNFINKSENLVIKEYNRLIKNWYKYNF